MTAEKADTTLQPSASDKPKIGPDVYENVRIFNTQLAIWSPSVMYVLNKSKEGFANVNLVNGVCGLVTGCIGFFGNRYYHQKGDDSGYSYMGQVIGGIQMSLGIMLFVLEATETYAASADTPILAKLLGNAAMTLSMTQTAMILLNSHLYADATRKIAPVPNGKTI